MTDITLHLGDCLEYMRGMEAESVDIVITSPPYNVGLKYTTYNDNVGEAEHRDFVAQIMTETARVMAEGGRAYWIVSDAMLFWLKDVGEQAGLRYAQTLAWCKPNLAGVNGRISGDWNFLTEWILLFRKGKRTPMQSGKGVNTHNFFVIPSPQSNWKKEHKEHPAQFPIELPRRLIARTPGRIVLDPFMGAGSTGIAALMEQRSFLGIEIDSGYFEIAERRIAEAQMQSRLVEA